MRIITPIKCTDILKSVGNDHDRVSTFSPLEHELLTTSNMNTLLPTLVSLGTAVTGCLEVVIHVAFL